MTPSDHLTVLRFGARLGLSAVVVAAIALITGNAWARAFLVVIIVAQLTYSTLHHAGIVASDPG